MFVKSGDLDNVLNPKAHSFVPRKPRNIFQCGFCDEKGHSDDRCFVNWKSVHFNPEYARKKYAAKKDNSMPREIPPNPPNLLLGENNQQWLASPDSSKNISALAVISVDVNGHILSALIDTGCDCSAINKNNALVNSLHNIPSTVSIKGFSGVTAESNEALVVDAMDFSPFTLTDIKLHFISNLNYVLLMGVDIFNQIELLRMI